MPQEALWVIMLGRPTDDESLARSYYKRTQIQRLLTGDKNLAELSRELDIRPM